MTNKILYGGLSSPPGPGDFLKRPQLDALIKQSIRKTLTTVVAEAGYGKTQAVFSVLKSSRIKLAWIQLSELDNLITRLWERVAFAFKPHSNTLYEGMLSLGYPETPAAFDSFLRLIAKELAEKGRFVFVMDDFHTINNEKIITFLERLIHVQIKNISVVLISRKKPPISLAGMQSKGIVSRITEDELRFTREETEEYLRLCGIETDEAMTESIYSYTNGWIFAIYLAGLAIKKGNITEKNPLFEARFDIYDLIDKEIFSAASEKLQKFLIDISVLDLIPIELLNEFANHDYSLISEMTETSLFVRYNSFSGMYRMHQLFKDFLLERKGVLPEKEKEAIHLAAAKWYEKNDRRFEAITHYEKCGRYNEVLDIVLSFTNNMSQEMANTFISIIEQTPDEVIAKRPIMRVAKARYLFNNNRIDEATRELLAIRKEFEALPKSEERQSILGEAYAMLALICVLNVDYEFEALFKMADECLPSGSKLIDAKTNIAEGVNVCSIKDPSAGELEKHQEAIFRAAPYASRVLNGCGHGIEYLNAAESSLYTGNLKAAEKYAYEAIYRSRQFQQYDIECMASFVLVRVYTAKGNYEKISEVLEVLRMQTENLESSDCKPLYDIVEGWFYTKIDQSENVASWINYEGETRKKLIPVFLGREFLVRSEKLLAEGRHFELLAFMRQTDRLYKERGVLFARIQNKITKALLYHNMGNHEKSMETLSKAYALTNPNGLIMQYVEYGSRMRVLILAAKRSKVCDIPLKWLNEIYAKSTLYAKQILQIVRDYNTAHELDKDQIRLSKRQTEVLSYLCRGLTRKEIAESCYLSMSTVDDIVKHIYAKLGAANGPDAVRIAKEKELV